MSPVDRSRLPPPGGVPVFDLPGVAKHSLDNSLRLWTVEHRGVSLVAALLLFPVGSAADPVARPGLAAATADLLDEGAGARPGLALHDAVARIGGRLKIGVNADATALSLLMLTKFKERGLSLLADLAVRPQMREEDFERVRQLRLSRLAQFGRDPSAVADRAFMRLAYGGGHPYGHLPIGTEEALRALELAELVSFGRSAYRPAGATLIVVGDASHAELALAARAAFGDWPVAAPTTASVPLRDRDAALASPPVSSRLALVHRDAAAQSALRIGLPAASRGDPDYHRTHVLNMVLGGQFASRIMLNLREDKGYTYGARTSFDFRRAPGPFVMETSVQTDATAAAIQEVLAELEGICEGRPVTAPELLVAQAALTRGYPREFQTAEQVARALGSLALHGLSEDELTQFPARVSSVDAKAVTRVARKYLDPNRLLTVVVGDREAVGPSLAALGLGAPAPLS